MVCAARLKGKFDWISGKFHRLVGAVELLLKHTDYHFPVCA